MSMVWSALPATRVAEILVSPMGILIDDWLRSFHWWIFLLISEADVVLGLL